jgi:hypothetical protein
MITWSLIISILFVVGIVVGLYMNPNTETLMMIVVISTLVVYGINRYWRHPEGFLTQR